MSVIRVHHNKENPYVMLSKETLSLEDLSWEAKGLWSYLMSLPDDWELRVEHLSKTFGCGLERTRRILNELIRHGLCERTRQRVEEGKWGKIDYTIYEEPLKKCSPHTGFPCTEKPSVYKVITNSTSSKEEVDLDRRINKSPHPRSGRKDSQKERKLTPRESGTNPRAIGTNPRAKKTNPREDIEKNKALSRKVEKCLSLQTRIPVEFFYNRLNLWVELSTKGIGKLIPWNCRKEDFKNSLQKILESFGFDLSLPPSSGFVKSYGDEK